METKLTRLVAEAAICIKSGGVVAFPTETVYGLGADAFNAEAVAKIFEAKRRPGDNPLIAHVGSMDEIGSLADDVNPTAKLLIERFFPGPLTLVLAKSHRVPDAATAGLETIGVRMPASELANDFLRTCGVPVVAPSANLSGRPSPTTWQDVYEDLNGRIECILQGEATDIGLESTVVDCTTDTPFVLRAGAVSLESLRAVVPFTQIYRADDHAAPRSPGMRHKHYAPAAEVVIVDAGFEIPGQEAAGYIGMARANGSTGLEKLCDSVEEYARSLFAFFRECDRMKIRRIYCERVDEEGIGAALMDRLRRAEVR